MKTKGSTLVATGTVLTILFTMFTGVLAWNFKDKAEVIDRTTATVADLKVDNAVNKNDIMYIKQGIDDLRATNKEILKALK